VGLYIHLSYFHPFQQFFIHVDKFYPFFIHYSSNFPTLNNVEKIVWPTVYAVLGVVPNLFPTVVPSSCSTLLRTHSTSTTLFPILSKLTVSVLSFEDLTDNSIVSLGSSVFFPGDQASAIASGDWPRWGIFGGNCSHLLQK
jgi:hypothetical protein